MYRLIKYFNGMHFKYLDVSLSKFLWPCSVMCLYMCYHHNLTGPEDGPRATWAEGDHRGGLRIGFYVSVLRARMAVYLVRIV
jgi:hypothetical protein